MPDQISLIEIAVMDVTDRSHMSMVTDIGEGRVLGRPAKLRQTVNHSRIEIVVDSRIYTIDLRDLLTRALGAIEDDLRAKVAARALSVHARPSQADPDVVHAARAIFAGLGETP